MIKKEQNISKSYPEQLFKFAEFSINSSLNQSETEMLIELAI